MSKEAAALYSLLRTKLTKVKINQFVELVRKRKRNLSEVLTTDVNDLRTFIEQLKFEEKDLENLIEARKLLGNSSFLIEDIVSKGVNLITIYDKNYPKSFFKKIEKYKWPPIIYCKGNLELLNKKAISIVGSRDANEKSLKFTENISKKYVEKGYAIVSGFARGVDRTAFEKALEFGGETIVVLPQGILTFNLQSKYYKFYAQGRILIISTFLPSSSWNVGFAMERNDYIYALGEKVFIAESNNHGGTWNGANKAIKQQMKNVFVRYPKQHENNANLLLIERGLVPVDINGEVIDIERKKIEDSIVEILKKHDSGVTVSEIKKELSTIENISSQKLASILRKMEEVDYEKRKNKCIYFLKGKKCEQLIFDGFMPEK